MNCDYIVVDHCVIIQPMERRSRAWIAGLVSDSSDCCSIDPYSAGWSEQERDKLGQELSDTLLYLVRLAERCHIDLPSEMIKKFELNETKFPIKTTSAS